MFRNPPDTGWCSYENKEVLMSIRFTHINIVSTDWRRLASFYEKVLGCVPVYPERDLSGKWLDAATGVENARISGIHLRLPGYSDGAPTLEIFQYENMPDRLEMRINRPGLAHLAFAVENVEKTVALVCSNGGSRLGELTTVEVENAGRITFCYTMDPEGNIIELQKWDG